MLIFFTPSIWQYNVCIHMNRSFFVGNFKSKKRKRETKQSSVSLQESDLPIEQSQEGGPSFKKSKRETLYSCYKCV